MLTKRTNILFDEKMWQMLNKWAKEENTSIGKIVRKSIQIAHESHTQLKKRQSAIDRILKIRPKPFKGKIDYKALINEGRRY